MATWTPPVLKPRVCETCGANYDPASARQKYCKDCGRRGFGTCDICGNRFRNTGHTTGRYCSKPCSDIGKTNEDQRRRPCAVCGLLFKPRSKVNLCCSKTCAGKLRRERRPRTLRKCQACGVMFEAPRATSRQHTCSVACATTYRWEVAFPIGSKRVNQDGYVMVKVGKHHSSANTNGWIMEHRYVMEQAIGRHLLRSETVHHKNGDRVDNRLENLELRVGNHGSGQRLPDVLADNARLREELKRLQDALKATT